MALTLAAPAGALAAAWTLPAGEGQIIATLFGWAGQGASYGGAPVVKENRIEAQTYIEYGLADRLTAVGQAALERYELSPPSADVFRGLDYSEIGLRAKLWSDDALAISFQATAFAPGAHEASRPAQAGNTGGALEARALAGCNFMLYAWPSFVDAEVAFRLRAAGPPDEWHGDATMGVQLGPRVTILLQSFNTVSTGSGSPVFLAWSSHTAELSVVYALDDHWSVQVGTFSTFATVNTNSQRGLTGAIWRNF